MRSLSWTKGKKKYVHFYEKGKDKEFVSAKNNNFLKLFFMFGFFFHCFLSES